MAKSKYAPALFEVISAATKDEKQSGKLALPKWWKNKSDQTSNPPAAEAANNADLAAPVPPAARAEAQPAQEAQPSQISENYDVTAKKPGPPAYSGPAASLAPVGEGSQAALSGNGSHAATAGPTAAPATRSRLAGFGTSPPGGIGSDPLEDPPPVARVREGRVELSLNPTNTVVAVGVLLLTLFLAYQLGRGLSPSSPGPIASAADGTDELKAVSNSPAKPDVLDVGNNSAPAGRAPAATAGRSANAAAGRTPAAAGSRTGAAPVTPPAATESTPPKPGERVPGLNYVVFESLRREHQAEAEQLQQWLAGQNIPTTIERSGDRWQIVGMQGFAAAEKAKGDEFCLIVKSLGTKYKAEFGVKALYNMGSPYLKLYTGR